MWLVWLFIVSDNVSILHALKRGVYANKLLMSVS